MNPPRSEPLMATSSRASTGFILVDHRRPGTRQASGNGWLFAARTVQCALTRSNEDAELAGTSSFDDVYQRTDSHLAAGDTGAKPEPYYEYRTKCTT